MVTKSGLTTTKSGNHRKTTTLGSFSSLSINDTNKKSGVFGSNRKSSCFASDRRHKSIASSGSLDSPERKFMSPNKMKVTKNLFTRSNSSDDNNNSNSMNSAVSPQVI